MKQLNINKIVVFLIAVLTSCCSVNLERAKDIAVIKLAESTSNITTLNFIGFKNDIPVYLKFNDNILYLIEQHQSRLFKELSNDCMIFFINDNGMILQNKLTNEIIIDFNGNQVKIPSPTFMNSLSATSNLDTIYFFDDYKVNDIKILLTNEKKIISLPIKGNDPRIGGGYLYFSQYSDPASSEPFADLFRTKLNDLNNVDTVLYDILERWEMSDDGRYIACMQSKDSDWINCIYDVKNNRFKYFDIPESYQFSYFDKKKKGFVFYNQNDIQEDTLVLVEN